MALGDPYIDEDDLAAYLGVTDSEDATLMTAACAAATEWVNQHCQRQFQKTTTSSDRTYVARDPWHLEVDDFHTTTGLVIATDESDDGTYGTTWTAADYVLKPFDGIEAGMTGFPYRKVVAVESEMFPCRTGRPRVRVTAQWGWNAVPHSVTLASKVVAAFLFNLKDSPLGVASFADAGLIRVRDVPQAAMLLENYRHPAHSGPLVA
jgi:hypothetical protein